MKQKILLLLAVGFGVLAFVLTYQQLQSAKAAITEQTHPYAMTALRSAKLPGEEIRREDLVSREVLRRPNDISSNEIPYQHRDLIVGRKLANMVPADRLLLYSDLEPETRDKGFSGQPRQYRRAYAISVDAVSAVNYLIRPGDKVDIIGTFVLPDYRGDSSIDTVTVTLLQNVVVLATGTQWGTYGSSAGEAGRAYSTVTLELMPEEVEIVSFAALKGRLSLSLRNISDTRINLQNQSVNFKTMLDSLPDLARIRMENR